MADDWRANAEDAFVVNQPVVLKLNPLRCAHIVVVEKRDEIALRPFDNLVPCGRNPEIARLDDKADVITLPGDGTDHVWCVICRCVVDDDDFQWPPSLR